MAGDWIKMEVCTPEKAEVLAITAILGWEDADLTVGKLFRLWRWFDQHTADGNVDGVTSALLDRIVGVTGFCDALTQVGWLTACDGSISLPNFDRHNGNTAKKRALTAKRVANHKSNAKGNAKGNATTVTSALPREEKRREEREEDISLVTPLPRDDPDERDRAYARKPENPQPEPPDCPPRPSPSPAAQASIAMRKAGLANVNPGHPTLQAMVEAGVEVDAFADAAADAVGRGKGFAYAMSILTSRVKEAAEIAKLGRVGLEKKTAIDPRLQGAI